MKKIHIFPVIVSSFILPSLMLSAGWQHNTMREFCRGTHSDIGSECLIDGGYSGIIFISWWIPSLIGISLIYVILYFIFKKKVNETTTQSKTGRSEE